MLLLSPSAARNMVYSLPPDKLATAIHLSHARTLAYFGGTAWTVLILWLLARGRLGEAIANWAARRTKRIWLQGLIVAPLWLLILSLVDLPLAVFMHRTYRAAGISVESWQLWFADYAKSLGLTLLFGTLALSGVYALMRWSGRRWWLWTWLLSIPVVVVSVFIVPILIDPLFDNFTPLAARDPALVQQLQRVSERGGLNISPDRMFVMDASRKVAAPNAYVTGFGASKRIVVWDTTLTMETPDEILAMYGHEQGHYVLHHIYLGMMFSFAGMFVFFWIAHHLLSWLVRRVGDSWHIAALEDWSSMGLVLLLFTLMTFFAEPVGNAFSRWEEHAADVYGQEVLHGLVADPQQTCAQSFQRLGELWLDDPGPNPFIEFWTDTHPSIAERVKFAATYDPWAPGQQPRYVAP